MQRIIFLFLVCVLGATSCDRGNDASASKTLRITAQDLSDCIDPRRARSLASATTLRMVYEGLLRKAPDGTLVPGIAERWEISDDGLVYTFHLRESEWSDGTPVTADDFSYAWKQQLTPGFPSPNAYQLYCIRDARAARDGRAPIDTVGINVLDSRTLEIHLDTPSASFLELTAFHALFPISKACDQRDSLWHEHGRESVLANGPFMPSGPNTVVRNPRYWDASAVQLDAIELIEENDETTALLLFEQGEIDWAGSSLSAIPADALDDLRSRGLLRTTAAAGTQFLRFNTKSPLLAEQEIRQALSYAINRAELVEFLLKAGQTPSTALVPGSISGIDPSQRTFFSDNAAVAAKQLWKRALGDRQPTLVLMYSNSERYHRLAQVLQQQWKKVLGAEVELRRVEAKAVYDNIKRGEYQIAISSWFADIDDPSNFLQVFERSDNGTNNTGWEDSRYVALLAAANSERDISKRAMLLQQAEQLLMEAMPIAPINTFSFAFLQSDTVSGVTFSPLGYLDFKYAHKE